MKIYQSLTVIISAAVIIISCRKTDTVAENQQPYNTELSAATSNEPAWITASGWQSLQTKKSSVNYFVIQDSSITRAIATKGLVLVYKKKENTITTLPFEEAGEGKNIYWFYQVSENSISVIKEGSSLSNAPENNDSFLYYVLTEAQVNSLTDKGYSPDKLMQLSFEDMTALQKK